MPRVFLIKRHLADPVEFEDDEQEYNSPIFNGRILSGEYILSNLDKEIFFIFTKFLSPLSASLSTFLRTLFPSPKWHGSSNREACLCTEQ